MCIRDRSNRSKTVLDLSDCRPDHRQFWGGLRDQDIFTQRHAAGLLTNRITHTKTYGGFLDHHKQQTVETENTASAQSSS